MAKGDWVHRDEYHNQRELYEFKIRGMQDEIDRLNEQLRTLQDHRHTTDDYIEDAEIVED